jgi:hypothetical protein
MGAVRRDREIELCDLGLSPEICGCALRSHTHSPDHAWWSSGMGLHEMA